MWDIPRNYVMASSNAVHLVPLHPIVISILFHHHKELKECMRHAEEIRGDKRVDNNNNDNHYISSSSNGGGFIVMMTEQENPLETYDEMVREMEQEIIIREEDIEVIEV
jgi:hypothetical protein